MEGQFNISESTKKFIILIIFLKFIFIFLATRHVES